MSQPWTNGLALFAEDFSLRVAITLLHFLWQGCAIGTIVLLLNRILRASSATSRYLLHTVALLMMPLCVVLTFAVTEVPSDWRPATMEAMGAATPGPSVELNTAASSDKLGDVTHGMIGLPGNEGEREAGRQVPWAAVGQDTQIQTATSEHAAKPKTQPLFPKLAPGLVLTYFFGVGMFLLRFALAMWGGHRLRSASTAIRESELLNMIVNQSRKVGLRLVPAVRYCERVSVPVVVGVLRPVILLPASLISGLAPEQFAAIVSHELAHIRRYDLFVNLLQRVVESALFFHPAVWYFSRRMNAEREICCDDLVVSSGYEPMDYAGALLRMAELCSATRSVEARARVHALAASGEHPSQLESRIWRLVNMNRESRFRMTRAGSLVVTLLTLTVMGMPAIVHRFAQADEPKQAHSQSELGENDHANRDTQSAKAMPDTGSGKEEESVVPQPPIDKNWADLKNQRLKQRVSSTTQPIWVQDNIGHDPLVLPNGRCLTGSVIRDMSTGEKLGELELGSQTPHLNLIVMKVSSNGRFLLECSSEPVTSSTFQFPPMKIRVWDLTTFKQVGVTLSLSQWRHELNGMRRCFDVSSDGKFVVAVLGASLAKALGERGVTFDPDSDSREPEPIRDEGGIIVWNVEVGQKETHPYRGSGNQVDTVALSPDGRWLVISDQNKLTYWKWKTKEKPTTISVGRRVVSLAFSPDSRFLAEGPDSQRDIQIRDMQTLATVSLKDADESPLYINTDALTFSRDGKRLIAGNTITVDERKRKVPHRISVWNFQEGELSHQIAIPNHQVWSLCVAPGGDKIVARLVDGGKSLVAAWSLNDKSTAVTIKPGMTFFQVMGAKGRHYRPLFGSRAGQLILVYDDLSVYVENHHRRDDGGLVSRVDPTSEEGIGEIVQSIAYADEPASGGTNLLEADESDPPTERQASFAKIKRASLSAPDKLHAVGLTCRNPMGWKSIVYLPPDRAWKLFGAIRPIPNPHLVTSGPNDGNFYIAPSSQGRIVELESSLSINHDGKWQILVEADRPILQGTRLAAWGFFRHGDDEREEIASYVSRQKKARSYGISSPDIKRVIRKQNDKLELLSARYVPVTWDEPITAKTLLPGYCIWIEATEPRILKKNPETRNSTHGKGLGFLAAYPKLHELSLDMTEIQFLEIGKRQGLKPTRSTDGSTYSIATDDGHEVLVMFGNNGDKCSGIQRLRTGGIQPLPKR